MLKLEQHIFDKVHFALYMYNDFKTIFRLYNLESPFVLINRRRYTELVMNILS